MDLAIAGLVVAVLVMTASWAASVVRQNASYVDRTWGLLFPALALTYAVGADQLTARARVVFVLASAWGLRLAVHLITRGWGRGEEWRHRQQRKKHPQTFWLVSLLSFFWPQAIAAVAVSTPLMAVAFDSHGGFGALDVIGVTMWVMGIGLEGVADAQLRRFKTIRGDPAAVLDTGLWRYSRHPNYFGDALMWWGLGLVGVAAGHPWAVAGPAGMTVVLVLGSGVRAMDAHMLATRGERYAEYARRTSAFIPLKPRGPRLRATEPSG